MSQLDLAGKTITHALISTYLHKLDDNSIGDDVDDSDDSAKEEGVEVDNNSRNGDITDPLGDAGDAGEQNILTNKSKQEIGNKCD